MRRLFRLTSALNDGDPICGEHERLHEAIRDHDELKAEELARAHVAGTRAAMRYLAAGATENRDSSTQS
ncbi:FCD domain-containing protein [Streptomyces sp. NBC_01224]|uniref:FCD domain-containing protein n=1 Tax=Streptomyces sp. NBC_01224 TaxID=2903783 RepID=UPI002E168710